MQSYPVWRGPGGSVGDSAYQAWLDAGNAGSEADFLANVSRVADFASRTAMASYAAANPDKLPGALLCVGGVFFARAEGATAIPDLPGFVPSGEITPFHFGNGAAGWQHEINAAQDYAATTGRMRVAIPAGIRKSIALTGPFTPRSGVEVYGIGNPEMEVSVSGIIDALGVVGFSLRDVTIIGPYSGTSYVLRLGAGCSRCTLDVTFVGTNSGIVVTDATDNIITVRGWNVRGTLCKLTGAGAVRNHVPLVEAENVSGFGLLIEYGACDNQVGEVRKWVNLDTLPDAQKSGSQWDEATGRLGLEGLGITPQCYRNRINSVDARSTHDNGVSISGDYNSVDYVYAENCAHEGLHFYGSYNSCGFLHARANYMSGAGASAGETSGLGSWNTILNGLAIDNGYNAARFGTIGDNNDFRLRGINNTQGDWRNYGGTGNRFNAFPNGLDTTYQVITGFEDQIIQTVTSSTRVPQISQVKKGTGETDVSSGTTLGRWDVAGWLAGVAQSAARISVVAASTVDGLLRAKWRFQVRNAEGVLRPALTIDSEGRIGVAKRTAVDEYAPQVELDIDGATRMSSAALKAVVLSDYAGAAIDATYASMLHIAPVSGGATLGAITSLAVGDQILVLKNTTSNPLTIPHSATGIRTAAGRDVVLGAYKSILLMRATGAVWDEIGAPRPSDFLTLLNLSMAAYDGSPVDATGRGVLSIAPAATATVLGALSSSTSGYHVVVIVNTSANTLVIPHATSGFRLNGKADVTLGAYQSIMLMHITGTIWQQI